MPRTTDHEPQITARWFTLDLDPPVDVFEVKLKCCNYTCNVSRSTSDNDRSVETRSRLMLVEAVAYALDGSAQKGDPPCRRCVVVAMQRYTLPSEVIEAGRLRHAAQR